MDETAAESTVIRWSISVLPRLVPSSASSDAPSRLRSSPINSVLAGKGDVSLNKTGQTTLGCVTVLSFNKMIIIEVYL